MGVDEVHGRYFGILQIIIVNVVNLSPLFPVPETIESSNSVHEFKA